MEGFLLLMNSAIESWMNTSTMDIAMDMSFGIVCGVGLFFLLTPFLKKYPLSPPPESQRDIPQDVKRRQRKTRKKSSTVKDYRNSRKNAHDTQNASPPMESPTRHHLMDSSSQPFWNCKEILHQLTLSRLFSHLRGLEDLLQHKFIRIVWGISSVLSDSVVATAWVSRESPSGGCKSVRFSDTCDPVQALPMSQGPPQPFQDLPLPHKLVTPNLGGVTGVKELENLPISMPKQTPSSFQSRTCGMAGPTPKMGMQVLLPTENEPWKERLSWKDITGCKVQNHQAANRQHTDNLPRGTPPTKAIGSASVLPEHCQMPQDHEEPQKGGKTTNVGRKQSTHVRFLPSLELTQLQEQFQEDNSDHYCKSRPQCSQPAQPSTLNPMEIPLRKVIAKCDIHNTINKGHSAGDRDVPCTSSSTPGKELKPRNAEVRTDKLSSMNTTEDLSFLDPKSQMKLEPKIMQLPVKRRRKLPCISKAEYYAKAAMILERLHHRGPGGTRVETISTARLQSPLFEHSPSEVQGTQRAPPTASIHGPSKSHPDPHQRYLSVQPHTFCFLAKPQQSRRLQGSARSCLLPNASRGSARHPPWKGSEDAASGHPHCKAARVSPEESAPSLVATQTNTLKVKEETHNGQAIKTDFESVEANGSPGHLQIPTPQHSGDLALKPTVYSKVNVRTSKPENHHPDGPSTVHPATVRLPSQHSVPSFQTTRQKPKTSQGLGDVCMRSGESAENQQSRVRMDKFAAKNDNTFHPCKGRTSTLKYGGISQVERPSTLSSTQLKDIANTESQSSLYKQGKREALPKSSLQNIKRNAARYGNLSTKFKGQGDSLKNKSSTPSTEQTQEVTERENFIYSTAVESQPLTNVLVQNLVSNVDASDAPECKAESLTFQLDGSSSEGLYDPNHIRAASRMSSGHASPEEHDQPFTYRAVGDKEQPSVDHKAFDPHQSIKKGVDCGCLMNPNENQPVKCRRTGGQEQSAAAAQGDSGPDEIRTKSGKEFCPHRSPEMHSHSLRYRESGDKLQPCVNAQRACDHHPYSVKRMVFDQLPTPKGNDHPHRSRGIGDKQQSGLADQRTCEPGQIRRSSSRMDCYPHRSPEEYHHSLRYKESGGKQHPGIVWRACDPHQSTKEGTGCGHLMSPKENHPIKNKGTRDKEQSDFAAQEASDPR